MPAPPQLRTLIFEVLEEFGPVGGASVELVAWELGLRTRELRAAWGELLRDGQFQQCGVDQRSGEVMYRLACRR